MTNICRIYMRNYHIEITLSVVMSKLGVLDCNQYYF